MRTRLCCMLQETCAFGASATGTYVPYAQSDESPEAQSHAT